MKSESKQRVINNTLKQGMKSGAPVNRELQ